jgi:uncharacterized membrane protein
MTIGPVQLLVIGFDEPNFHGQIAAELARLRENDLVRVIDALAVQKDDAGEVTTAQFTDLSTEEAEELGAYVGALLGLGIGEEAVEAGALAGAAAGADSHLLEAEQIEDAVAAIPNGSAAGIALLEHRWAIPLRDAILSAGGSPIVDAWVHPIDLVSAGLLAADELDALGARG